MSIGYQSQLTVPGVNSTLGQIAVNLRNACAAAQAFDQQISVLGAAGLEAVGFTAADAASLVQAAGFMNQVAAVYYGQAAQGTVSNFDSALAPARGGQ